MGSCPARSRLASSTLLLWVPAFECRTLPVSDTLLRFRGARDSRPRWALESAALSRVRLLFLEGIQLRLRWVCSMMRVAISLRVLLLDVRGRWEVVVRGIFRLRYGWQVLPSNRSGRPDRSEVRTGKSVRPY